MEIQDQIRQAYLSYRVSARELVDLAESLRQGDASAAQRQLETFVRSGHDEPGEVEPEALQRAHDELGLSKEFAELPKDQPWSPYQRALYRRLSHPEYDPKPYQNSPDQPGSPLLCEIVTQNFVEWDRDNNIRLTADEIDRAMARDDNPSDVDAALVVLRSRMNSLGNCYPADGDGITQRDIAVFTLQGMPGNGQGTERCNSDFETLRIQAAQMRPAGPLLNENFDAAGLTQNRLGSCVLLATTASLKMNEVKLGPAEPSQQDNGTLSDSGFTYAKDFPHNSTSATFEIPASSEQKSWEMKSMFAKEDNGYYSVTFKNGDVEYVAEPTRSERLYHAHGLAGERWPALLEIAAGQHLMVEKNREASGLSRPKTVSIRDAADGIAPEVAFELMANRNVKRTSIDDISPQQAREVLQDLVDGEGPRICGSRPELPASLPEQEIEFLHNGIENSHAYSILGYDSKNDTVVLRNPWNRKLWVHSPEAAAGKPGGVFTIPFEQFYASYRWVAGPAAAQEG